MSKKPKKKAAKAGKRYAGKKSAQAFSGAATRRAKGPRSTPLPGMGQVRSKKLDNLCEAIGEARGAMNAAKIEEQASIQAALQIMQKENRTAFRHASVELMRVPGAEKLRVRITKEQGDADDADLESGAGDEGTENDALGDERREALNELDGEGAGDVH